VYAGSDKAWMNYLLSKLRSAKYPDEYFEGKIYGTVYILFIVNPDGKITDPKVVTSIDPQLDEIALRIIRESPKWEPAVQYNRNVKAYRKQPITFSKVE
ncbi:MAG: energy transducer TonB, partial [Chitinophagaceae bacterium]